MFEDIINFFKGKKSEKNSGMRKSSPIIITVCILAIIIPSVIAICYAYFYDDTETISTSTVEFKLYNSEDTTLFSAEVSQAELSSYPLVESFYGIVLNKKEVSVSADTLEKHNYVFSVKTTDMSEKYNCYFSSSSKNSYIQNENGTFFSVDENYYAEFLNSEFSESAYSTSQTPSLITGDGETVTASLMKWSYRKQNGTFANSTSIETTDKQKTYKIGGSINIYFDIAPSESEAEVYDQNGEKIFTGAPEELQFVSVETGETLSVKLRARWEEIDSKDFFGEATYDFQLTLTNKAEFYLSSDKTSTGSFIIIYLKNVNNISKIIYAPISSNASNAILNVTPANDTQEIAIKELYSFEPLFITENNYAVAILPFSQNLPSGSFSFSLNFGASQKEFTVTVEQKEESTTHIIQKDSLSLSYITSALGKQSLDQTLRSPTAPTQQMIFSRGEFLSPSAHGFIQGYSFTDILISNDSLSSFDSIGCEFLATESGGQAVRAINIGVVIKTDYCPHLGNYVVVEHALGLRTWYCGLSDTDVKEGDIVKSGEQLGKSGNHIMTSQSGFLLLCTVGDVLIDPSYIIGKNFSPNNS